jgi:uncharacterized membrane protein
MGGYFGLLMGTSILTLCEIIDLFLYHAVVKFHERYDGRKQRRRHVINVDIVKTTTDNSTDGDVIEDKPPTVCATESKGNVINLE